MLLNSSSCKSDEEEADGDGYRRVCESSGYNHHEHSQTKNHQHSDKNHPHHHHHQKIFTCWSHLSLFFFLVFHSFSDLTCLAVSTTSTTSPRSTVMLTFQSSPAKLYSSTIHPTTISSTNKLNQSDNYQNDESSENWPTSSSTSSSSPVFSLRQLSEDVSNSTFNLTITTTTEDSLLPLNTVDPEYELFR